MSQENVEIVCRALDMMNRGDLDAFDELVTHDAEWVPAMPGAVGGGNYRGREGFEAYLAEYREAWSAFRVVLAEYRDLGDRVLAFGRVEGRGKGSGVQVDAPVGMVIDFRGGKISRARGYLDYSEALRAAGLAE
jgi:ketosteroid isomerase-like protein